MLGNVKIVIEDSDAKARRCHKWTRRLLKKAKKLSIQRNCDVGVIVFSPEGILQHFPKSSVDPIIEKYQAYLPQDRMGENEAQSKKQDEEALIFSQMDGKELENLSTVQLHRLEEKTQNFLNLIKATLWEKQERRVTELEHIARRGTELEHTEWRVTELEHTVCKLELTIANMREKDQVKGDGVGNVANQDQTLPDSVHTQT